MIGRAAFDQSAYKKSAPDQRADFCFRKYLPVALHETPKLSQFPLQLE